ncbi:MAG: prenyltransferase [Bacteroidetes bacterium]|nr:MAG: prenyltransferase [Bacteroidota bacterium]
MATTLRNILRLIRFPNLLIIAATQYAMRYLLMEPLLPSREFSLQFGDLQFGLLVIATMLIAAGGYIINDYFDTRTDLINKPAKVVVGLGISRRRAMIMHSMMNIVGVGIGVYLAFYIKLPSLAFVFVLATGLLWFYSTHYKRQFLVGNISVSILTGLVPLMVVLFEIPLLNRSYGEIMLRHDSNFNYMVAWVGGFSFFAFLTTLLREVVKDLEDFEGDMAYGMRTLPIILGSRWTKVVILVLIGANAASLAYLLIRHILFSVEPPDYYSLAYFSLLLELPLLVLAGIILRAKKKKHYHHASTLIKFIMLAGILYSLLVFYLLNFKY